MSGYVIKNYITPEEAIEKLMGTRFYKEGAKYVKDYGVEPNPTFSAYRLAIETLEKQIPKKLDDGVCSCGCINLPGDFCPKCGQAIDWEG